MRVVLGCLHYSNIFQNVSGRTSLYLFSSMCEVANICCCFVVAVLRAFVMALFWRLPPYLWLKMEQTPLCGNDHPYWFDFSFMVPYVWDIRCDHLHWLHVCTRRILKIGTELFRAIVQYFKHKFSILTILLELLDNFLLDSLVQLSYGDEFSSSPIVAEPIRSRERSWDTFRLIQVTTLDWWRFLERDTISRKVIIISHKEGSDYNLNLQWVQFNDPGMIVSRWAHGKRSTSPLAVCSILVDFFINVNIEAPLGATFDLWVAFKHRFSRDGAKNG